MDPDQAPGRITHCHDDDRLPATARPRGPGIRSPSRPAAVTATRPCAPVRCGPLGVRAREELLAVLLQEVEGEEAGQGHFGGEADGAAGAGGGSALQRLERQPACLGVPDDQFAIEDQAVRQLRLGGRPRSGHRSWTSAPRWVCTSTVPPGPAAVNSSRPMTVQLLLVRHPCPQRRRARHRLCGLRRSSHSGSRAGRDGRQPPGPVRQRGYRPAPRGATDTAPPRHRGNTLHQGEMGWPRVGCGPRGRGGQVGGQG